MKKTASDVDIQVYLDWQEKLASPWIGSGGYVPNVDFMEAVLSHLTGFPLIGE